MEKRWTESETGTDSRETETTHRDAQTNACLISFPPVPCPESRVSLSGVFSVCSLSSIVRGSFL